METRSLTADQIHDGQGWLPAGSTIEVSSDGTILDILPQPTAQTEFFEGVLTPGFVNTHAHLELSHLRGVLPEATGLIPFLQTVAGQRGDFSVEDKSIARGKAFDEMLNNGIVATGDIANTTDTLDLRATGKMDFHTFVEAIGFVPGTAGKAFERDLETLQAFRAQANAHLTQSITPHAPYSVSEKYFQLIDQYEPGSIISIHNQEAEAENDFYHSVTGEVLNLLNGFGIPYDHFTATNTSSLQGYGKWLSPTHPLILVHNTYSREKDLQFVTNKFPKHWFCLCPNANWYIERRLPDIDLLMTHSSNICIGTDSLASNHQLCVLSELVTLKEHFPMLNWEEMICWATLNGAKALRMDQRLGRIQPGRQPGIVQITGLSGTKKPAVKRVL